VEQTLKMARLSYVPDGAEDVVDRLYAEIRGRGRPVVNLYRVLANQPPALEAFLCASKYVRAGSSLEPGLRELLIIATAHELGQEYELAHHTEAAWAAGVAPQKVADALAGGGAGAMTPQEEAATAYARQAASTRDCEPEVFARLLEVFPADSVVDVVVTAAWYQLCAVILNSLRVDLEASLAGPPD
jgi:4-carboxymuconolactone decarboxylase